MTIHHAEQAELDRFLREHPDIEMLEVLMPDMNGILRCKRIHRREFQSLVDGQLKSVATLPLVTTMGEYFDEVDAELIAGEPDKPLLPIAGTLSVVPWLSSPTGQVLASHAELDGSPCWVDPRTVLHRVLDRFEASGLRPVVAAEIEFYLVIPGDGPAPEPLLGSIPGTGLVQSGIQYSMAEDLWERDRFLDEVRMACQLQGVPLTTIHSEFGPGQWEINIRHVDDPITACDHAVLLKRIIKGVALKNGMSACFMAKPFPEMDGSGLHIHASLYDRQGNNLFNDPASEATPAISEVLRHAVGGMARTMPDAMAIFAPNANSYRRFVPGAYVPLSPNWGYNHRDVSMRIPVSGHDHRRVEHRVAGADANPYLVVAAVLAGMHAGISRGLEPGPMVAEGTVVAEPEMRLPARWEAALQAFAQSEVMREYLGEDYWSAFKSMRSAECEAFHARIPNLDYEWYLRAV